ncbi:hypothetical protein [Thermococcus aciditolerans]|uniref:Uncharacterized protein n=1 Tax=Thermococcus aciditolerans TaxID=2598455 RepID=A0A5C0SNJ7_9EURY|nr:hypothetical protein [Thermococcus aciditolerans]QEK14449.1 hypothetical protein FPV09_04280 [Thermococcus aciditolerans]
MAVSLEGFSSFLLIVISPFLLLSLAVLIGNKDVIHRINFWEGTARIYTWTIILPTCYLLFLFSFQMTVKYYLVGTILFVLITLGALYVTGAIKGDPHKAEKVFRHDYMLVSILAAVYILLPAYAVFFRTGVSISAVIYFAIALLYFRYSLSLLREIHKKAPKISRTKNRE